MNNDGYFPPYQQMQTVTNSGLFGIGNVVRFADYSARIKKPVRSRLMGYAQEDTPKGEVIFLAERQQHA